MVTVGDSNGGDDGNDGGSGSWCLEELAQALGLGVLVNFEKIRDLLLLRGLGGVAKRQKRVDWVDVAIWQFSGGAV